MEKKNNDNYDQLEQGLNFEALLELIQVLVKNYPEFAPALSGITENLRNQLTKLHEVLAEISSNLVPVQNMADRASETDNKDSL